MKVEGEGDKKKS